MTKKIVTITLLTATLLLVGCIKEDISACFRGVKLHFSYVLAGGEDQLLTKTKDIRVYAFDHNGVLINTLDIDPATLIGGNKDVDIAPGSYTFVAWAGSSKDMFTGGYREASMTSADIATTPIVGVTTLEEFRMMLKTKNSSVGLVPETAVFDDLFYAIAENVVINNTSQIQSVELDFMQESKVIGVTVEGLSHLTPIRGANVPPLNIFLTAANDRYNYQSLIDTNAPTVRYESPYKILTADEMVVDIKTLKLDIEHSLTNPVLLYIQKTDGTNLISPIKVIEAIMQIKDPHGNLIFINQNDIRKEERFNFTFYVNLDLSVTVAINGFAIENLSPELE